MKIVGSESPLSSEEVLHGYVIHERTLAAFSKLLLIAQVLIIAVALGFLLIADALDGSIFLKLPLAALVLCLTLVAIVRVDRVEREVGKLVHRP